MIFFVMAAWGRKTERVPVWILITGIILASHLRSDTLGERLIF